MLAKGKEAQAKAEQDRQASEKDALDKAINTLKDTWKGDEFAKRVERAHRAFTKFGGDEGKAFLEETKIGDLKLGDHPVFLKLFAAVADAISEDTMADGGRGGGGDGVKTDEQKAQGRFPNTKFNS